MKIRNLILGLLLIFFNSSCYHSFDNKTLHWIKNNCNQNKDCILNINDLTDFKWDKSYVFGATASENINRVLGFNYPYYREFSTLIMFLKNNEIVYHQEIDSNIEKVDNNEIVFIGNDSINYVSITHQNERFKVQVDSTEDGVYYKLIQLN